METTKPTIANIEKGVHLLWPDEWLRDTKASLGRDLRNAQGPHGERVAKAYTAVVEEIDRRRANGSATSDSGTAA